MKAYWGVCVVHPSACFIPEIPQRILIKFRSEEEQKNGDNCTVKSYVICILHQILLE
jgi:hypothetical protein